MVVTQIICLDLDDHLRGRSIPEWRPQNPTYLTWYDGHSTQSPPSTRVGCLIFALWGRPCAVPEGRRDLAARGRCILLITWATGGHANRRLGFEWQSYHGGWATRTLGNAGHRAHIIKPIWEKSRFGKKFEPYHQNRMKDKMQMPNMGLNLISQRWTRMIVPARPQSVPLLSLWLPWAMLITGCPK